MRLTDLTQQLKEGSNRPYSSSRATFSTGCLASSLSTASMLTGLLKGPQQDDDIPRRVKERAWSAAR